MNKKFFIFLIILFSLAAGAVLVYIYSKKLNVPDKLSYYMPRETVLYAEFNLKDKKLNEFYKNNFRGAVRFKRMLKISKFYAVLSKDLISRVNKVVLMIIPQDGKWHKVWLVQANNIYKLNALLPKNYYSSILNAKTLAVSKDRKILRRIHQVEPLAELSKEQINILNQFDKANFINIYLSGAYLKFLSERDDITYAFVLNNLDLNYAKPAYLGLVADNNKINYNFFALSNEEYNFKKIGNFLPLIENKDLFLSFYVSNLKQVFELVKDSIINDKNWKDWPQKYEFDWNEVENLLDARGVVFAKLKNNARVDTNDAFDLSKYNYGVLISLRQAQIEQKQILVEKIKKIVKNILAFKYPAKISKRLPDGSQSIELVADAQNFNFERDGDVEFYENPTYHFAIGTKGGYLILGNNKKLIKQILGSITIFDRRGIFRCAQTDKIGQMLLMNSKQLLSGVLSYVDQILINIDQSQKKLDLEGCLKW